MLTTIFSVCYLKSKRRIIMPSNECFFLNEKKRRQKKKKRKSACASRREDFCINNMFQPCGLMFSFAIFTNGISYGKSIRIYWNMLIYLFNLIWTANISIWFYLVYCRKREREKENRLFRLPKKMFKLHKIKRDREGKSERK